MNASRRRRVFPAVAAATLLALTALHAAAQEQPDTFRLREVVVTATRVPTALGAAPGSVTLLTADELRMRGVQTAAEALRLVPGMTVMQSAGPGAQSSVFMRGGESDYIQVLVDGVHVNDVGGAYNWAHLRADDIDRIEVVRGPASVLYGSDAVAGVVQIFTRAGGAPRIQAGFTGARGERAIGEGTFATNTWDASFSGTATPAALGPATLRYGASAARTSSTGLYELNNDYENTTASGRVQLAAAAGDLAVTARNTDHRYHFPTSGSGAIVDPNQFATGSSLALSVDGGVRLLPRLELRLLGTSHTTDSRNEDPADDETEAAWFWNTAEETRRKLDARVNAFLPASLVLTAGVEREWQDARTALESVSSWGTFTDESGESRRNTGFYAQLHGTPVRGLSATAGARSDDNEAFGTFRTGRLAVSWLPAAGARLHTAVGTAFKAPTFFETFATGFTRGNPDLQPERARSWEAGAEYAFAEGMLTVGGTWFDQRFRNLIQYTAAPPSPQAPNYFNVGSARARGAELSAAAALAGAEVRVAYTLTDTRVLDEGFGTDVAFQQAQRLLRRPEHQVHASLDAALTGRLRGLLDVRYTGERDDLDFTDPAQWQGVRVVLPAYTVVDLAGAWTVSLRRDSDVELTLRVRNLLDEQYQEIFNFATPGRVLQLGVRAATGF
jgi:vitamin B12 transporter